MLQEVTDLMTEKEIRLRVPLEELDLLTAASRPIDDDPSSGSSTRAHAESERI